MNGRIRKKFFLSFNELKMKKKLLFMYFGVFLIPMILMVVFLSQKVYQTLASWEQSQAELNLTQCQTYFNNILLDVGELSDRLYINDPLLRVINTQYSEGLDVYEEYSNMTFLDDYMKFYKEIRNIRIYVDNETLLNNSYFIKATEEMKAADWYVKAIEMNGKIFWTLKEDDIRGKTYFSLVRSIWDTRTKKFVGVLSLNLDTDKITSFLSSQQFETLICLDGIVVFGPNEDIRYLKPSFLEEPVVDGSRIFLENIIWDDEKSMALIRNFASSRGLYDTFQLVYIIPRNRLLTTTRQVFVFSGIVLFIGFLFSFLFIMVFSQNINARVYRIRNEMKKVVQNNFEMNESIGGTDEFAEIYSDLYEATGNIKTLINEVYKRKVEQEQLISRQNDIRFKMLSSQINPHFLFNTLETIRMKSLENNDKDVANTIKLLANILRYNLKIIHREVPLISELDVISNYLDIQQVRFGDRVSYDILCLCDIRRIHVLPLLIQPIVENSFIHGLESKVKGGFIYITITTEKKDDIELLCIEVKDNGNGISNEKLLEIQKKLVIGKIEEISSSIGLINVQQRIKLFYGLEYGITIQSIVQEETKICIRIPLVIKNSER